MVTSYREDEGVFSFLLAIRARQSSRAMASHSSSSVGLRVANFGDRMTPDAN
jgi:hypothetical protein